MKITIRLNGNNASLELLQGDKIVEKMTWHANHKLSDEILLNIDALLKKNNIDAYAIEAVDAEVDETAGVTATRVVQTIAKAWSAGVRYS